MNTSFGGSDANDDTGDSCETGGCGESSDCRDSVDCGESGNCWEFGYCGKPRGGEAGGVGEAGGGGGETGSRSTLKLELSRLDCWFSEKLFFDSFTIFLILLKNVFSW